MQRICDSDASNDMAELTTVIPGRCKASNLRCTIAHRGISRFRVRADARPGMTSYVALLSALAGPLVDHGRPAKQRPCDRYLVLVRKLPDQGAWCIGEQG